MKVKKGLILAAGYGTRLLPITKAIPKEMLTIVDKPSIQYIVEEMSLSGIEDIMIVTSRGKNVIEDYFDRLPEIESVLEKKGRVDELEMLKSISSLANISFTRQQQMDGTGTAVYCAHSFIGSDPFVMAYADDVMIGKVPVTRQITDAFEKTGKSVVAMREVPTSLVRQYSSLSISPRSDGYYDINDMIEKPTQEQILSNYAILGRCVLTADILEILARTEPGANNEIQLTDGMKHLAQQEGMIGVDFEGERYDMGSKLGALMAAVEVGARHDEVGEDFKKFIKMFAKTL